MAQHQILPAAIKYTNVLCEAALKKKQLGIACNAELALIQQLSSATDLLFEHCTNLRAELDRAPEDKTENVLYYHDVIVARMNMFRHQADIIEQLTDKSFWPYPTYSDLLFY